MTKLIIPYLDTQIKYEENYYDQLTALLGLLISYLLRYIKRDGTINSAKLKEGFQIWINEHQPQLNNLIKTQAVMIMKIIQLAMQSDKLQKITYGNLLLRQIKVAQDNVIDATWGQFVNMLPIGITGVYHGFFTDEVTKEDLYTRSNKYVRRLAAKVYTQGVFNGMLLEAKMAGLSEYVADNQHDEKVRALHKEWFNGERWIDFSLAPPCGHVGTESNCRCYIIKMR